MEAGWVEGRERERSLGGEGGGGGRDGELGTSVVVDIVLIKESTVASSAKNNPMSQLDIPLQFALRRDPSQFSNNPSARMSIASVLSFSKADFFHYIVVLFRGLVYGVDVLGLHLGFCYKDFKYFVFMYS